MTIRYYNPCHNFGYYTHIWCQEITLSSPEEIDKSSLFHWQAQEGRLMKTGTLSLINVWYNRALRAPTETLAK